MNKDKEFFEKNFYKIMPLVNYDFEKNKVNAKTNLDFFTNFYYIKNDISDQNTEDNEKIKTTLNFYKYLCKKENLEKLSLIFTTKPLQLPYVKKTDLKTLSYPDNLPSTEFNKWIINLREKNKTVEIKRIYLDTQEY